MASDAPALLRAIATCWSSPRKSCPRPRGAMSNCATSFRLRAPIAACGERPQGPARRRGHSLGGAARSCAIAEGVLIVAHRLGFVMANAGVDQSNIEHRTETIASCSCPTNPDASCAMLKVAAGRGICRRSRHRHQRQLRPAVAQWRSRCRARAAGLPSLLNLVGALDLFGRPMRVTEVAFADEIAAAASMLMGQAPRRFAARACARARMGRVPPQCGRSR